MRMKYKWRFILLLFLFLSNVNVNAKKRIPNDNKRCVYLMVYHKDADHGLHMAYSFDGYVWTSINNDKPLICGDSIAEQRGIRDPHIFRSPDGTFILAMTDLHVFGKRYGYRDTEWERPKEYGWGNNRGLVLMKSDDLIHWTRFNLDFTKVTASDNIMKEWSEVGCVWAPEMVWDSEANKVLMHFTTRYKNGANCIYYVYLNDNYDGIATQPKILFHAPFDADGNLKYNVIDSDIIKSGDTYHLFYVSHEKTATVKHATSTHLTGPYILDDYYDDGESQGHEAPNCWKMMNENKWTLMFDNYHRKPHNFGFVQTSDFMTFTPIGYFDAPNSPMKRTNFSEQKHGAVVTITKKELKKLLKYWN